MFTNNLVMFRFRSFSKILVGDCFNKGVWKLSQVIPGPEHQDVTLPSSWITEFGSSLLEDEDRQEDLGILV